MHSIGIDVSQFNCTITKAKLLNYNFELLTKEITKIKQAIQDFETDSNIQQFERELVFELAKFNKAYFPNPQFRRNVYTKQVNEDKFAKENEREFLSIYNSLIKKYAVKLKQDRNKTFLDKWYIKNTPNDILRHCELKFPNLGEAIPN